MGSWARQALKPGIAHGQSDEWAAPAKKVTKVPPLWSRPFWPWLKGMRPNSVVQMNVASNGIHPT
jgi:hypothetical protein